MGCAAPKMLKILNCMPMSGSTKEPSPKIRSVAPHAPSFFFMSNSFQLINAAGEPHLGQKLCPASSAHPQARFEQTGLFAGLTAGDPHLGQKLWPGSSAHPQARFEQTGLLAGLAAGEPHLGQKLCSAVSAVPQAWFEQSAVSTDLAGDAAAGAGLPQRLQNGVPVSGAPHTQREAAGGKAFAGAGIAAGSVVIQAAEVSSRSSTRYSAGGGSDWVH
jgi:hypothetical protein